jgi:hypothetical protein
MDAPVAAVLHPVLEPRVRDFYLRAMDLLDRAQVRYLVGGAYALAHHAGIVRHTKDLDLFICRADYPHATRALQSSGFQTDLTFPHWLGKAFYGDAFVDLIFGSGNGLCGVDEEWFAHGVEAEAIGRPAKLCAAEEIIWTKSFIQERERFDGADVAHLLLARGPQLDWPRLLRRFLGHERVLLGHVIFFGYIYPAQRARVPAWVSEHLLRTVRDEPATDEPLCRGTNFSRQQYLIDIHERGFADPRRHAYGGNLSDDDIQRWTAAIDTAK